MSMTKIADDYKTNKRIFEDYLAKAYYYANSETPELRYKENSGNCVTFCPEFSNGQFGKTGNTIAQIVHKAKKYLSFASDVLHSFRLDLEETREKTRYNKLLSKLEEKLEKIKVDINKILGGSRVR